MAIMRAACAVPVLATLAAAGRGWWPDADKHHDFMDMGNRYYREVAPWDHGPYEIAPMLWAEQMAAPAYEGTYAVPAAFNVSSARREPMDGWTVTYATQPWIEADLLSHRDRPETYENSTFTGASVRLNPPASLIDFAHNRGNRNNSIEDLPPSLTPGLSVQWRANHINWRVCAARVVIRLEYPQTWQGLDELNRKKHGDAWPDQADDSCGGIIPPDCVRELETFSVRTSALDACDLTAFVRPDDDPWAPSVNSSSALWDLLPSCMHPNRTALELDVKTLTYPVPLAYANWTHESVYRYPDRMPRGAQAEGINWLQGSELWSMAGRLQETEDRWTRGKEDPRDDFSTWDVLEQSHGVLVAWVHNEGGLYGEEPEDASTVSWSMVCHRRQNLTEAGKRQNRALDKQFSPVEEDSSAAAEGLGVRWSGLGLAVTLALGFW